MAAQPDEEAILAALDTAPEAFAVFYRRHVAGLLGYFLRRTRDAEPAADLCVERRPGRVAREGVMRIAALAGAGERGEIADPERVPRPVRDAGAPVVVVAGTG